MGRDHVFIDIRNVSKTFQSSEGPVEAIKNISLSISRGEFVTVVGPSGCGKSTLLGMIAGITRPTAGNIFLDGVEVKGFNPDKIALMFQDHTLYPWRSALGNIEFPFEIRGLPSEQRRRESLKYVELVGLRGFENRYPSELSGGMKQRVALARSLAQGTDVMLMDEPFGALDEQTRLSLGEELVNIWKRTKKTIIFVTHRIFEATSLGDVVVLMSKRPAEVKGIYAVDAPRPRDLTMPSLDQLRNNIWHELKAEFVS